MRHGALCSDVTSLAFAADRLQPLGKFMKKVKLIRGENKTHIGNSFPAAIPTWGVPKWRQKHVLLPSAQHLWRGLQISPTSPAAECSWQKKNTLMLFGTVSTTPFLVFPVSLYAVFSRDKKFILAPVKVQPEKHWARPSASERGRHVGLKTPSVRQAAPFCLLSVSTGILKVSALTRPSKESGISPYQKPSDGGCYTPQRYLSLPSCGETHVDWLSASLARARKKLETWPCTQPHTQRRVFPSFKSRLLRTATRLFTWPRSIFRHVYKHTILSCLFRQNSHWMLWVRVCLYRWGLSP